MAIPRPIRLAGAVAIAIATYLVAYRHGQSAGARGCPECGNSLADQALRGDEELLAKMPTTERAMVDCLLEQPAARDALRSRLHSCLAEAPLQRAEPAPSEPVAEAAAAPSADGLLSELSGLRAAAAAALTPETPAAEAASADGAAGQLRPREHLLAQLEAAKANEALQVSSPTLEAAAPAAPAPALPPAAAGAVYVRITCAGNGRFLVLEPGKDWVACAGEPGVTSLLDGLFVRSDDAAGLAAFKHARTGRYLGIVPPGGEGPEWVVRAHAAQAGASERFEVRERKPAGAAGYSHLYNARCGCHVNHRFGTIVRGHGNTPGKPAGAVKSARMALERFDAAGVAAALEAERRTADAARAPIVAQMKQIHALGATNEVRVISYGLYGADPRYTVGVVRNAQLAPLVYPGWRVRVYLDNTVPAAVRAELKSLNVELQTMGGDGMGGGIGGMFWRFLVAADAGVDRFIVRDCDSRLNPRERLAVEEWIQSGKRVHTLRDHPNHDRPLNGGMWGGVKLAVADMATLVRKWSNREAYMGDLDFLNQQVWPRADVKGSQLGHDAYTCTKHPNSRPFPSRRPADYQHVGQVFFGDGQPRRGDIDDWMVGVKVPPQCRREPGFEYG